MNLAGAFSGRADPALRDPDARPRVPAAVQVAGYAPKAFGAGRVPAAEGGFTMVEIALCLAIIGFALVAIIGVLPSGLNVQKDNREETIIDQDAMVWMDAIRNGSRGYDDLTNYVRVITNIVSFYPVNNWTNVASTPSSTDVYVFTPTGSSRNGASFPFYLTNGLHIIGLLSTPKIVWTQPLTAAGVGGFSSNFIVANVQAMSGASVEKFPQTNATLLEAAFSYRLIPELTDYVPFDPSSIHLTLYGDRRSFDAALADIGDNVLTNEPPFPPDTTPWTEAQRRAYWDQVRAARRVIGVAYTNTHDLRLTFRWPLLPRGAAGTSRHTFRVLAGGQLMETFSPHTGVPNVPLYFLQPSTYDVQAQ
jgi:type II secretory pathway pseudopilin PulG